MGETHHERLSREWASGAADDHILEFAGRHGKAASWRKFVSRCAPALGLSPALLKLVFTGEEVEEDEETVDGCRRFTRGRRPTRCRHAPRYDAFRTMLSEFNGAPFADYAFTPAPDLCGRGRRRRRPGSFRGERHLAPAYHFSNNHFKSADTFAFITVTKKDTP